MSQRGAVLGFRPHTYWTAAVALTGEPLEPDVAARRRIDFAAGDERSVYHRVEGLPGDEAQAWIDGVWTATEANCRRGLETMLNELARDGVAFGLAVVPIGRGPVRDRLEDIVLSHSRIHAAEGDFYRGVVAAACTALGLDVRRAVERDLPGEVARRHGLGPADIDGRLRSIGAALGPPWGEDQKLAALAAWSRLGALAAEA